MPTTVDAFSTGELSELSGISCPAANQCAAVGNSAMAERWNGAKWSLAPLAASTSYSRLQSVACPSATTCFAVGHAFPLLEFADHPLIERWDGTTWSVVAGPTITGTNVYAWLASISCVTVADCTAVGDYHDRAPASSNQPFGLALIEHWDGSRWSHVKSPAPSKLHTDDVELAGVDCTSATDCKAVGSYMTYDRKHGTVVHPLAEHWNGAKWSIMTLPGSGQDALTGISCPSSASCFALGASIDHWDGARLDGNGRPEAAGRNELHAHRRVVPEHDRLHGGRHALRGRRRFDADRALERHQLVDHTEPDADERRVEHERRVVHERDELHRGRRNRRARAHLDQPDPENVAHRTLGRHRVVDRPGASFPTPLTAGSLHGITCTNEIGCTVVGAAFGGTSPLTYGSYTLVERDT